MVKKFNLLKIAFLLISFFFILFYSNKLFSFEGTAEIIVKKASVYDLKDNLLINLNKNDTVCICNKKNKSWGNSYFSVCDEFNKLKGVIARNYVGRLTKTTCSSTYTKSNTLVTSKKENKNIISNFKNLPYFGEFSINDSISAFRKNNSIKCEESYVDNILPIIDKIDLLYDQLASTSNDKKILYLHTFNYIELTKQALLQTCRIKYGDSPRWKYMCGEYPSDDPTVGRYTDVCFNAEHKLSNDKFSILREKFYNNYSQVSLNYERDKNKKTEIASTKINEKTPQPSTTSSSQVTTQEQNVVVENDIEGPRITVQSTFESDSEYTAYIEGRITDASKIVSLVIDGDEVSIENNQFMKPLYVQRRGQEVTIVARDKHGNKTETRVQLVRSEIVVEEDTFEFLDPRKIQAKPNKNAVALIIGVEEYENTVAAPYASKDAEIFSEFANLSLGIPVTNIKLLTNNDAKRSNTLIALEDWLPKKIIPDKTELYVFYAGHGLASEDNNDLYLLPSDGVPSILDRTTLLRNNIFDIIYELNPKRVTMFFDTCYSGTTRSEEVMVASRPIQLIEDQAIPYEFNIFSASSINETAKVLDEAEHGLFSYFMMKGLEGEADSNNDKQITNGELYEFIASNVSRFANQTPQLNGDPEQILVQW